jgi:hypothetical protein
MRACSFGNGINPAGDIVGTGTCALRRQGARLPAESAVHVDVIRRTNTVMRLNPTGVNVGTYTVGSATHRFIGVPIQDEQ